MVDGLKRAGWAGIDTTGTTSTAELQVAIMERFAAATLSSTDLALVSHVKFAGGKSVILRQ